MTKQLLVRFLVGGLVVSAFSGLGDVAKPKSFAGLFGAAPSVALATLGLAIATEGSAYASLEAQSMMLGAAALFLYTSGVSRIMMRYNLAAMTVSLALLPVWFAAALGLWLVFLR